MKYALKKAKRVIFADTVTTQHTCTLNDLTSVKLSNGADEVDATGADGAKLAIFDTKKTTDITLSNGAIETGMIELQTGSTEKTVLNGTGIRMRESFTLTTGNTTTVTLSHKPSGTAGAEVKYIYKSDTNGNPSKTSYLQAATASATEFSYAPTTKILTLPTGIFAAGDTVIVDYYPTYSEYKQIDNNADSFSFASIVIIDGWWTDLCTGKDVPMQAVCERGKTSGKFDLEFGDKAAVQDVTISAMSTNCAGEDKTLWTMYTYDNAKILDT
jgi:hypothetical protein